MKPYGVKKQDIGCCFGHDKYPTPKLVNSKPKNFKNHERARKKSARQSLKKECST